MADALNLVNADKSQMAGEQAWAVIGDIEHNIPSSDESGLYNKGVDLYNKLISTDDVMPGAKSSSYLIFKTSDVTKVKSFFVGSYASPSTEQMKK